jgi:monofunctional biosynthetic peptidoglycan transglycosylase
VWGRFKRFLLLSLLAFVALTVGSVLLLRWLPPPGSAFMVHQFFSNLFDDRPHDLAYEWRSWGKISAYAGLAVMAAEDQKFPDHLGFDFEAIEKAQAHNENHRRKRGASTISQQVAKNLFLWPSRSWLRKGVEAYFTVLIEALWPKKRILEVYLNIVELGPDTYGDEAAAQRFWRKPAARLSPHEAALLAAVLPNPKRFRANAPSGYVQSRAQWIEGQMGQLGLGTVRDLEAD